VKILLVKTTSLGDLIHTLPAITDLFQHVPNCTLDWVVEKSFSEIPSWHPNVRRIIPVSLRAWRKNWKNAIFSGEIKQFISALRTEEYDIVLDAQGLIKSALISRFAKGRKHGLDQKSAREPWASLLYQDKHSVLWGQHAVSRVRQLFAATFGYPAPTNTPDYGLSFAKDILKSETDIMLFHGTTWDTKYWPDSHWRALAQKCLAAGLTVKLPWGNDLEKARAERIAVDLPGVTVLPKLNLRALAEIMASLRGAVAVDTGLGHLSAALDLPCLSIYGPTNPIATGTFGRNQIHLSDQLNCRPCLQEKCTVDPTASFPPCMQNVHPEMVWQRFSPLIGL
jgi:heptosyltransferase-1